jgi:TonB family protein
VRERTKTGRRTNCESGWDCDSILRQSMSYAARNLTPTYLLVAAALFSAQSNINPRALLEEIASSERGTRSWRAEGVETSELTGEGMNLHAEISFKAAYRDTSHLRWESGGDNRSLTVCDGADHWTYAEPGTGFYRNPVGASPCRSQLPPFSGLLDNMVSVAFVGADQVQFEGVSTNCTMIRAEYRIPASRSASTTAGTTIIRTICVEPTRRLILRDRTETWATGSNARSIRTITFSSYQRDADITEAAFRFEVPTGTFLDPGPQITDAGSAVDGTYRVGAGVSRPQLIQAIEPSWTEEAREAGISGLVLVSCTVDSGGNPQDLAVARGLGYGLDQNALEAVRQWHFRPGLKDGTPVAVGNLTVAVSFHLP